MWHLNLSKIGRSLFLLAGLSWSASHAADVLPGKPSGSESSKATTAATASTPGAFRHLQAAPSDPAVGSESTSHATSAPVDLNQAQVPPEAAPTETPQPTVATPPATTQPTTAKPPTAAAPHAMREPVAVPRAAPQRPTHAPYYRRYVRRGPGYDVRPPRVQRRRAAAAHPRYSRWAGHPRRAGYPAFGHRSRGRPVPPYATAPVHQRSAPAPAAVNTKPSQPTPTPTEQPTDRPLNEVTPASVSHQPEEPQPAESPTNPAKTASGAGQPPAANTSQLGQFRPPELEGTP